MILAAAAAVVVFLLLNIFSHIQANFFMTSLLLKLSHSLYHLLRLMGFDLCGCRTAMQIIFFIVDKMERKQMKFVKGWNFFF